jgi:hypothetical protein
MNFWIEPVTSVSLQAAASYVREQVFGHECRIRVPPLPAGETVLTLIARSESDANPAAVLTVLETTGDEELHRGLGLIFNKDTRVARYTQLAVLRPYRGQHMASRLVFEAHRQFVAPRRIDYTWLLFGAGRANSSSFCRQLGFAASPETFFTEYGRCRVLTRNEHSTAAELSHWRSLQSAATPNGNGHAPGIIEPQQFSQESARC